MNVEIALILMFAMPMKGHFPGFAQQQNLPVQRFTMMHAYLITTCAFQLQGESTNKLSYHILCQEKESGTFLKKSENRPPIGDPSTLLSSFRAGVQSSQPLGTF